MRCDATLAFTRRGWEAICPVTIDDPWGAMEACSWTGASMGTPPPQLQPPPDAGIPTEPPQLVHPLPPAEA